MLRSWQKEAIKAAIEKYHQSDRHFFCQATPAAGKTIFAAEVGAYLLDHGMVDVILCLAPSKAICDGIEHTFSTRLNRPFKGGLGGIGQVMTYQALQFIPQDFWVTLEGKRIFVVFDEIHHCSGNEGFKGNTWGQLILSKIQNLATYSLALSGTPWRSDCVPIVLSQYTGSDGQLVVDYQYSLSKAVSDGICRSPKVVLVDNEQLSLKRDENTESYSSILDYIKRSKASYQSVIFNNKAMNYILKLGCDKLNSIRQHSPNAGGLVVAASVSHAKLIHTKLTEELNQSAIIVTYENETPEKDIKTFRSGNTQWIVSVGMVSEGTDIPRLQVCCHLSSIKTELYFRQVLGRILRITDTPNQEAWLFTFAEESLSEYAERIEEDIPESCLHLKLFEHCESEKNESRALPTIKRGLADKPSLSAITQDTGLFWGQSPSSDLPYAIYLEANELRLGNFKQRVISCFYND